VVTNTGNIPLANAVVRDDKLGTITSFTGDANSNGVLDLTETWTYIATATALAGQQTNIGTATADDVDIDTTVTDSDAANYFGGTAGISIVKFVNGQDANSAPGPHVPAGSTVTFTYVVTNTGSVPLANVVVADDKLGPITILTGDVNGNALLDLTETWTYTKTATALAGQQINVGSVTAAHVASGTPATDSDGGNYFGDAPATTTTTTTPSGALPPTGGSTSRGLTPAIGLLAVGLALAAIARRRPRTVDGAPNR
jgi:hypothetical protein